MRFVVAVRLAVPVRFAVATAVVLAIALVPVPAVSQSGPVADVKPVNLETHGEIRVDNYYWLRDRNDPAVIAYLEAENAYTDAYASRYAGLADAVFEEMKGRIKQDDASVPYRKGDYYYYNRFVEGKEYPVYARRKGSMDADEEVMLDVNEMALAAGSDYYQISGVQVSPDANFVAFGVDNIGRRNYTLRVKDLRSGRILDDEIVDVTSNVAWASDNATLFYVDKDPQTLRAFRVYRHAVGSDSASDVLVFEESDEEYSTYVFRTKSDRFVMIGSSQTLSDEYRFVDANDPTSDFTVVQPRQKNLEYSVDHHGEYFYIRTNRNGASNFKLVRAPIANPAADSWTDVIPHRQDTYLAGFDLFDKYLVASERRDALLHVSIHPWDGSASHNLEFDEPAYLAYTTTNVEFDTNQLRYNYTSMTTPQSTFEYNMSTRTQTLLKVEEVLGGFDKGNYITERLWFDARDGTRVPISLVYHRSTPIDGSAPLFLYAYGSYGSSTDASFVSSRLSLLDRGFVFAIAHVRGGQEMGRSWYEDGKLFNKMNTFTDFIDAADHLDTAGYIDGSRIYANGGSAGGLLMGAIVNMRADRFHGVVAAVPFVDVVTTMLDETIPLTTFEYDEWGNPNQRDYYDYMMSYSPYDNVSAKEYPNLLVTTGLHDSQVQYWEPAKWVAKLRAMKTDSNTLLLKTNMSAGHGGSSGRFERLRERAFEYAFVLDLAGSTEIVPSTE